MRFPLCFERIDDVADDGVHSFGNSLVVTNEDVSKGFFCAISSEVSPISAMRRWYMVSPPVWGLVVIISQVGSGLRGGEMDGAFLVLVA